MPVGVAGFPLNSIGQSVPQAPQVVQGHLLGGQTVMERRHHYPDPPEFPCPPPLPPHRQPLWGLRMVADGGLDEENFESRLAGTRPG